nr:MAG TPA: hypothetical protein [Caudoviricetes sp.]
MACTSEGVSLMSSKRKLKRRNPAPVAGFKYERMC